MDAGKSLRRIGIIAAMALAGLFPCYRPDTGDIYNKSMQIAQTAEAQPVQKRDGNGLWYQTETYDWQHRMFERHSLEQLVRTAHPVELLARNGITKIYMLAARSGDYSGMVDGVAEECDNNGVSLYAWFFLDGEWLRKTLGAHSDWRYVGAEQDGLHPNKICPNNPDAQDAIAKLLGNYAKKHRIAGIVLDYEAGMCHCNFCEIRYAEWEENREDAGDYRATAATELMRKIRTQTDGKKLLLCTPKLNIENDHTSEGTNLDLSKLKEYVDGLMPMEYIGSDARIERITEDYARIKRIAGNRPVRPTIILETDNEDRVDSARIENEIQYLREVGAKHVDFFDVRFLPRFVDGNGRIKFLGKTKNS